MPLPFGRRLRALGRALLTAVAGTVVAVTVASSAGAAVPEDFRFGDLDPGAERPLLTILQDYEDVRFADDHSPAFYRRLLFGTEEGRLIGSVAGRGSFFDEASAGRFVYRHAGVLGPFRYPDDPETGVNESRYECALGWATGCGDRTREDLERHTRLALTAAIRAADAAGFDFAAYDANGDRSLTDDELTVMHVGAAQEGDHLTSAALSTPPAGAGYGLRYADGWIYGERPAGVRVRRLVRWVSGLRGDHYTTTAPLDADLRGDVRPPDYQFAGDEGWILADERPRTRALHLWYSRSRGDFVTSSDRRLAGEPGDRLPPDYEYIKRLGWVFDPYMQRAERPRGAVRLERWYTRGGAGLGASARGTEPGCVAVRGRVSVCLGLPTMGEGVSAATVAHELLHSLGISWEGYGSVCRNFFYTTMSCTITPGRDDRWIVGLDPFHRMRLGWTRPTVLTTDQAGCFPLGAADGTGPAGIPTTYLLHDPARGVRDHVLLDHRRTGSLHYDGDPWATGRVALPDEGLGVWTVAVDDAGRPLTVPAYDNPGSDAALYLLPPPPGTAGMPATPRTAGPASQPGGGLWTVRAGEMQPVWVDGTPTGARVRVISRSADGTVLWFQLNGGACPVRPTSVAAPVPTLGVADRERCRRVGERLRCTLRAAGATITRTWPAAVDPGRRFSVRLSLQRRSDGPTLRLAGRLPDGLQAVGRRPALVLHQSRRRIAGTFRLRASVAGRLLWSTRIRYRPRPRARVRTRTLGGPVTVWNPSAAVFNLLRAAPLSAVNPATVPAAPPPTPPQGQAPAPPPPAPPDLAVQELKPSAVTVINAGGTAAGPFVVRITASTPNGDLPPSELAFDGLGAGRTETRTFTCPQGATKLTALVDPRQAVAESDEGNNAAELAEPTC